MIVNINNTIVNLDNVLYIEKFYTLLKEPGSPEREEKPRIFIKYLHSESKTIYFGDKDTMEKFFSDILKSCTNYKFQLNN